ncbi:MAG TPA: FAD-dependent oxidoreductase [Bacteroidota bacterium]|nr:FAD-dependent oxidoreductase [Bacteroidota bacterium]
MPLANPMPQSKPYEPGRMEVLREAAKCLTCFDAPCTAACPAHIDIPGMIAMVRSGNLSGAAASVRRANALAAVCGAICPSEIYCQPACTQAKKGSPVRIREIHQYATMSERARPLNPVVAPQTGKTVAVIGGGPAGLGAAFRLAMRGHTVDLYNAGAPGGVPARSIPGFRLPDDVLAQDREFIAPWYRLHECVVDRLMFEKIAATHDALLIAVGLGRDRLPGIPGEHLTGVVPVLEFLERAKLDPGTFRSGERVVVIGGGNVSLDAAATARRSGARNVTLLYRRTQNEMRAWKAETDEAQRQGVEFRFLSIPVEILGAGGAVTGVRCRRTRLGQKQDNSGRRVPEEVPGSEFELPADTVIVAIGQVLRADWLPGIARTSAGYVRVDGNFMTSAPGVFAAGDAVGGEGTIVLSVAQGEIAAGAIDGYIMRGRDGES